MRDHFNFRLYLEGIKKIRLLGIAAAIVNVVLCAMIPVILYLDERNAAAQYVRVQDISLTTFAVPLLSMLVFSPFFVRAMFSYLNRRSESDFYHAIPYKRDAVYHSFMAAAFTWMAGIVVVSIAVTSLLYAISPYTTFASYIPWMLILIYLLSCALLMGMMSVGMSLTGTGASNLFIFVLLLCFMRAMLYMFFTTVSSLTKLWDVEYTFFAFLYPRYFLPLIVPLSVLAEDSNILLQPSVYLYTAIVSVLLYVAGMFLYRKRRSEMAGMSAPNRVLQHVYRIAFTLPFALIIPTVTLHDEMDAELFAVLLVIVLLVYFLYELITTKSVKNMLKATPWLGVVVALCLVFTGGAYLSKTVILSRQPSGDEIASVSFVSSTVGYDSMASDDYWEDKCKNVRIRNDEINEIVSKSLRDSVRQVKDGTYSRGDYVIIDESYYEKTSGMDYKPTTYERAWIRVYPKNGASFVRRIRMPSEDFDRMLTLFRQSEEYRNVYLSIPDAEGVYGGRALGGAYTEKEARDIYRVFYEEYQRLSDEEKERTHADGGEGFFDITFSVREKLKNYSVGFSVNETMPKTLQKIMEDGMETEILTNDGTAVTRRELAQEMLRRLRTGDFSDVAEFEEARKKDPNLNPGSYMLQQTKNDYYNAFLQFSCDGRMYPANLGFGEDLACEKNRRYFAEAAALPAVNEFRAEYREGDVLLLLEAQFDTVTDEGFYDSQYGSVYYFIDRKTAEKLIALYRIYCGDPWYGDPVKEGYDYGVIVD